MRFDRQGRSSGSGRLGPLAVLTPLLILMAHVTAFFAHEYAHAVTVWVLRWKTHLLDLHYGH